MRATSINIENLVAALAALGSRGILQRNPVAENGFSFTLLQLFKDGDVIYVEP
jgi:hypothetical protein